jgi:hypothetical protein
VALDPPLSGLDVRAVEFGARLRIDNATALPVVVEPLPGSAVSGLPVVLPGARAFWVDPRVLLAASAGPPPAADRAAWTVPLRAGNVRVLVLGEQLWPPPAPSWWAVALAALLLPAAAGLVGAAQPWGRRVLAASTAVVLVAHLVHVLGSALVPEDRPYPLMLLNAAGYALLGWPLGAAGGWLTLRGRPGGPLLCCVAGGLFALVIAPVDAFTLVDAVVPFAGGADLDRLVVALTLGGGLGVVVAGVAALRRGPVPAS